MFVPLVKFDARVQPAVAYIETHFPNGTTAGSGTLIGPNLLLTAGHVVFDPRLGGRPNGFTVILGNPRRTVSVLNWRTTGKWMNQDALLDDAGRIVSNSDLGVVVLSDPIDNAVPVFGQPQTSPHSVINAENLSVVGYSKHLPSSDRPNTLLGASTPQGGVMLNAAHRIIYPVATVGGMSGGPLYNPQFTIRGIHTSFINGAGGSALRITDGVYALIAGWLTEFHPSNH